MQKILNISLLTVLFLSSGISNAGFGHWVGRFDQWVAQRLLARVSKEEIEQQHRCFGITREYIETHLDRSGREQADEQHTQWVREALKAMGEKEWETIGVFKLKDDKEFEEHGGVTIHGLGIWLKHDPADPVRDNEFVAYHEAVHWIRRDADRRKYVEQQFIRPIVVTYAASFVGLQAIQLYLKKPFGMNSVSDGFRSLSLSALSALIPTSLLTMKLVSPGNNSIRQEVERQTDIQAAITLCRIGKADVVQKYVDAMIAEFRKVVIDVLNEELTCKNERDVCERLSLQKLQDNIKNYTVSSDNDRPELYETLHNLMRVLEEHRASSYALRATAVPGVALA